MENSKSIYKQLTNVDIDGEIEKWDERSKGYYGEYKVLQNIIYGLSGNYKILMNIELPIFNKSTEIDMIIIHEVGIFVVEIKYYKGIIYGNSKDDKWTQFFRTTKNNVFINPVKQNDYHMNVLKKHVTNIPIYSVVVFANDECQLKVKNNRNDVIITDLPNIQQHLNSVIKKQSKINSIEEIDNIFNKLKIYSNISEDRNNYYEYKYLGIHEFIDQLKESYNKQKRKNFKTLLIGIIIMFSILLFSYLSIKFSFQIKLENIRNQYAIELNNINDDYNKRIIQYKKQKDEAISRLREMENKFSRIDSFSDVEVKINKDAFKVNNFSLTKHKAIDDAYYLKFSIKNNSDFILQLKENTSLIVMLDNGEIIEYAVYGERLKYNTISQRIYQGKEARFLPFDLIGIKSKIVYIKLTNVDLVKIENYKYVSKVKDYQIELYNLQ